MEKIRTLRRDGKRSMIVVVSEGVRNPDGSSYAESLTKRIAEQTGVESKFMRTAHVVRGGNPTAKDRILASKVACHAIEHLIAGESNVVMCEVDGQIRSMDINFALLADKMYKKRLKPGALDHVSAEDLKKMQELGAKREEEIRTLYRTACDVSF